MCVCMRVRACMLVGLITAMICILFCSQFLYECSHPNKYGVPQIDLSNDNEASVDLPAKLSLSSDQLVVERLIVKVFTRYRCDVIITDRLRTPFRSKLCRMGNSTISQWSCSYKIDRQMEAVWTIELKGIEIVPTRKRTCNTSTEQK